MNQINRLDTLILSIQPQQSISTEYRFYAFPILNILVPHERQVPCVAGLPFFMVITFGSFISFFDLHFTQYACTTFSSITLLVVWTISSWHVLCQYSVCCTIYFFVGRVFGSLSEYKPWHFPLTRTRNKRGCHNGIPLLFLCVRVTFILSFWQCTWWECVSWQWLGVRTLLR